MSLGATLDPTWAGQGTHMLGGPLNSYGSSTGIFICFVSLEGRPLGPGMASHPASRSRREEGGRGIPGIPDCQNIDGFLGVNGFDSVIVN